MPDLLQKFHINRSALFEKNKALICCFFLFHSANALAEPDIELAPRLSNEDFGREQFPGDYAVAVPIGEANFFPSGAVRLSSIENLYYQGGGRNAVDATQLRVIPKLDLVAEGSKSVFWGLFRGDLRSHDSSSGDVSNADSSDFRLRGFGHFDFSNRHRLDLEASVSQLSEDLGTGRTREGFSAPLPIGSGNTFIENFDNSDTYQLSRVGLSYSYGNPRSRGELVFGFSSGSIEYTENEEALEEYNRDMSIVWGRFSYKLSGKTTLYSRVSRRDFDYTDEGGGTIASRDRETTSFTLGVNWKSTGIWYGDIYATNSSWDYVNRRSATGATVDGSDTTLGANLFWAIKSYSTANFFVRQFIDDRTAEGDEDTQTSSTYGVRWRHGWSDRFNTTVAMYNSEEESLGTTTSDRNVASVEGRLFVRRWMNVLVGATFDKLDSDGVDSDRNLLYLGLEGNL